MVQQIHIISYGVYRSMCNGVDETWSSVLLGIEVLQACTVMRLGIQDFCWSSVEDRSDGDLQTTMGYCHVTFHFSLVHGLLPTKYRGAEKSLARATSPCILFDGENISFDASLVMYIYIYK